MAPEVVATGADERVRAFLAETLALWRVDATLESIDAPGVARILTPAGTALRVERVPQPAPFRWMVRIEAGPVAGVERSCASLVGLLNALRRALGVECGSAIRIAREEA